MLGASFFIPISYENNPSKSFEARLLEKVDDYFYLWGRKAFVIKGVAKTEQERVIISEGKPSLIVGVVPLLARVAKIISYVTPIIFVMLTAKIILRARHHYHVIDPQKELEKEHSCCLQGSS